MAAGGAEGPGLAWTLLMRRRARRQRRPEGEERSEAMKEKRRSRLQFLGDDSTMGVVKAILKSEELSNPPRKGDSGYIGIYE